MQNEKVENEYGSYYTCDMKYRTDLRDIIINALGDDVVLFTTGKTNWTNTNYYDKLDIIFFFVFFLN